MRRWKLVIAIGAGFAFLLMSLSLRLREPVQHGKPLNYWLDQLLTTNRPQAEVVIREFGTNIIPTLRSKIRWEHSRLKTCYRNIWPALPNAVQQHFKGPVSVDDAEEPVYRALCALTSSAMPWLIDWLQSNDPNLRRVALYAISPIGPSASAAVPVLARFMDDSDPDTRYYAVSALACIGTSTNGAMPALIQATERNAIPIKARGLAAWALGRMGPVAKAGVPGVKRLLESTYSYPRIQAEIALWRIDSEATMIPLLVAELEKAQDVGSCDMILLALAETGAPVEAVPRIVSIIESPEEALPQFARSAQFARSNLAQHARQVLSKIDPEAATKIGRAAP